ncbi:MAG: cytochrome c-type biogenesis protein CcmH [Bryobacterales bacterium]|nr:cytochrome c-type biogenesis protein CcmH [Bryobacterales bacterium]
MTAQSDSSLGPRERKLADQLKSPCCWSESLLVHSSPEARRLRGELVEMVREGLTDEQILQRFVSGHGTRILRDPPGKNRVYLNVLPVLATLLGLVVVVRWILHARATPAAV